MALSRPKHGFESRWGRTSYTDFVSRGEYPPVIGVIFTIVINIFRPDVLGSVVWRPLPDGTRDNKPHE